MVVFRRSSFWRNLAIAALLAGTLFPGPAFAARHARASVATASADLAEFPTEAIAQAHCPNDVVVWLNTRTGIWHEKGMR